jgi:hypothetical protein
MVADVTTGQPAWIRSVDGHGPEVIGHDDVPVAVAFVERGSHEDDAGTVG